MTERPRSRRTVLVWWLTIAVMVAIAVVFLLITSPWNDPAPRQPHVPASHHHK